MTELVHIVITKNKCDGGHQSSHHVISSRHHASVPGSSVIPASSLPPIIQSSGLNPIRVEVHQIERWTAGSRPTLLALKAFHLPLDTDFYAGHSRAVKVNRARAPARRVRYFLFFLCQYYSDI